MPTSAWKLYTKKTKDCYIIHLKEVVYAIICTLFPEEIQSVLEHFYNTTANTTVEETTDSVLQDALIGSYGKADTWQMRRQILSVLATTMQYKSVLEKIPDLTEYRYYKAKKHAVVYGCALPPPSNDQHRQRMDPHKLDIFF